ncbi:MAG: transcriptional regulator [Opitutia bacterium]|nr:ROK family protein [Opitutales bacterium]PHX69140.1 MAG: transcriptional regulator [Opitutae bacterium]
MKKVLAFDLGGTKFAFGVVAENGEVLGSDKIETLAKQGPEQAIQRVNLAAQSLLQKLNIKPEELIGIGIASPGPLDISKGCVDGSPNLPGWTGYSIEQGLSTFFNLPARIDNDANAAALGEYKFGAGKNKKNMVYLTVSTGIGGGVIVDGRLMRGANGNAAELGHLTLNINGPACPCGANGCFEMYASGTAIARRTREAIQAGAPSQILSLAGSLEKITTHHILDALQKEDELAKKIWNETTEYLGRGLAVVINTFNPELIVVGGGVTAAGELLFKPVREKALRYAFPRLAAVCSIVPAGLGSNVGVVGAAACAFESTP